jgi:hypothetical protein
LPKKSVFSDPLIIDSIRDELIEIQKQHSEAPPGVTSAAVAYKATLDAYAYGYMPALRSHPELADDYLSYLLEAWHSILAKIRMSSDRDKEILLDEVEPVLKRRFAFWVENTSRIVDLSKIADCDEDSHGGLATFVERGWKYTPAELEAVKRLTAKFAKSRWLRIQAEVERFLADFRTRTEDQWRNDFLTAAKLASEIASKFYELVGKDVLDLYSEFPEYDEALIAEIPLLARDLLERRCRFISRELWFEEVNQGFSFFVRGMKPWKVFKSSEEQYYGGLEVGQQLSTTLSGLRAEASSRFAALAEAVEAFAIDAPEGDDPVAVSRQQQFRAAKLEYEKEKHGKLTQKTFGKFANPKWSDKTAEDYAGRFLRNERGDVVPFRVFERVLKNKLYLK